MNAVLLIYLYRLWSLMGCTYCKISYISASTSKGMLSLQDISDNSIVGKCLFTCNGALHYPFQQSVSYSYAAIANWKGIIRVNFILVFRFYIPLCLTILDKKIRWSSAWKIFTSQKKSTNACLLQIALKLHHHRRAWSALENQPCIFHIYIIAVCI